MFVDAEEIVREWLQERCSAPVRTRVPNPRPTLFVRAWRTGGAVINRILDAPILTVQVWGDEDAAPLAQLALQLRDHLFHSAVVSIPQATRIEEVTGLYYDPDPDSTSERYTFSVQLWLRAKT